MKKNAESYSQALLSLEGSKVLANFVMAIASDVNARSIVDYSARGLPLSILFTQQLSI